MGSGHDWMSDEEIAAETKRAADERKKFQRVIMAWYDQAISSHADPVLCTRTARGQVAITQEQGPKRLF